MRGRPSSVTVISVLPTGISVSGLENFAIWTLHPGYRDEFFAIAHALNGRWRSSAVSSHNKPAQMASFCFAWWIFHIISNPFNCSDTAKRVAKAMIGAKVITRLRFAIFVCFSNFAPKLVPRLFGRFSSRKLGWIFSYELKAKFVPVSGPARSTGFIWTGPQSHFNVNVEKGHYFLLKIKQHFFEKVRFF